MVELLRDPVVDDGNGRNEAGDAPIHAIVRHKRKRRLDLLVTLLTHGDVDVNLPGSDGNTALHFAVSVSYSKHERGSSGVCNQALVVTVPQQTSY